MGAKFVFYLLLSQTPIPSQPSLCEDNISVIRAKLTQVYGQPLYYGRVTATSFTTGKQYWASSDHSGQYVIEHPWLLDADF